MVSEGVEFSHLEFSSETVDILDFYFQNSIQQVSIYRKKIYKYWTDEKISKN